jgi:hypothetical protein
MRNNSPASEIPRQRVSVDGISRVSCDSLFFLFSLLVLFPESKVSTIESEPLFEIEKSLNAAHILFFQLFETENLRFLFFNCFNELIDISLLFIAIDLEIVLILDDIRFFHELVLFE